MIYYGKTDTGSVREENQDTFCVCELKLKCVDGPSLLAVVCDGMGGAAAGNLASKIAGDSFTGYVSRQINAFDEDLSNPDNIPFEKILRDGVRFANDRVLSFAASDISYKGMGTTLVGVLTVGDIIYAVNIGDSRMYAMEDGILRQVTHDHSFVQTLVDSGAITEKAAERHPGKNIILKAIGTSEIAEPDIFTVDTSPTFLLLCSDGLSNMVSDEEITSTLHESNDVQATAEKLIDMANNAGGKDNITVFLVKPYENI